MLKKIIMASKIHKGLMLVVACMLIIAGCSSSSGVTLTDVNTKVNNIISEGLYRFGPPMMGVSDSFDNMYYAARGGNWGLASYMSDVIDDFMGPTQLSKPSLYSQWEAMYKANLGDGTPINKAMSSKDFTAFDTAYSNVMTNMCNACHASNGFKFIQKIKAAGPAVDLNYSVQSSASDNQ